MALYQRALQEMITIAPGKMFSPGEQFAHCFRLNSSFELTEQRQRAISRLGELIRQQMSKI